MTDFAANRLNQDFGPPPVGLFPIEAASKHTQKSITIPSKCLRSRQTGQVRPSTHMDD